jgi:hypothetical protein
MNNVDRPAHYQSNNGVQVIDVIEHFGLGFHLGNVVKYVIRAGRKGDVREDIQKAIWYLERYLEVISHDHD